eukprot:c6057_g1_i1.p1 GENE.c6057_g1_i1~~c6057_g1_i1.p1  ORF type:complete len:267 (+),score=43.65 c6057_g1_i1:37-837(+)
MSQTDSPTQKPQYKGCEHYERSCLLVAPCCGEAFGCRFCHDLAKNENETDVKKQHVINRHLVERCICTECNTEQIVKQVCESCGSLMGKYYCDVCKLFDNNETKKIFHCDECGICRVGGRENYFHCSTCAVCLPISIKDNHKCVENTMKQDCPVCVLPQFESRDPSEILPCGHSIHCKCKKALIKSGSWPRCPLCNADMHDLSEAYCHLKEVIAQTAMPRAYRDTKVMILCNNCARKTETDFHIDGLECKACPASECGFGFNTRRL